MPRQEHDSSPTGRPPVLSIHSPTGASSSSIFATSASSTTAPQVTSASSAAAASDATSSTNNDNHSLSDGIINKTLFKCRKCKLLFWTTKEAAAHEKTCHEPRWFNCSVCQVLRFRSREERETHEKTCSGLMPLRLGDLPLAARMNAGSQASGDVCTKVGIKAESAVERELFENRGCSTWDETNNEHDIKGIGTIINTRTSLIAENPAVTSSSAQPIETPAVALSSAQPAPSGGAAPPPSTHGHCKESPAAAPSSTQPVRSSVAENDGSDSSVEFIETYKPPPQTIASSINETSKQINDSTQNTNQCTAAESANRPACPKRFDTKEPTEWTTVWTCDLCQKEQFNSYEEASEHEKLCVAKKQEAQKPPPADKKAQVNVAMQTTPSQISSALVAEKKKKGRTGGSENKAAKRQKANKATESATKLTHRSKHKEIKYGDMGCKVHIDFDGNQFLLGPLDGIPFLSSFLQAAAENLHPSLKFLLQQLELFTLLPGLEKVNSPPESVGIRCRNCIAEKNGCCFMNMSSVENMPRDLILMADEHVVRCKFMRVKDLKVVQGLKGVDTGSLAEYCNLIAKLYGLKKLKCDDHCLGAVWGDSPTFSAEYCKPADIDVSSLFGGSVPHLQAGSQAEMEEEFSKETKSKALD